MTELGAILEAQQDLRNERCDELAREEREAAYAACNAAIAAYRPPTLAQRTRSFLFMVSWRVRYATAKFCVVHLGWDFGKTWLRFGL